MMGSRDEIEEETLLRVVEPIEDKMYVAVGKDVKESEKTLAWALHNSGGRKICILHVHQPAQKIPMMGTKFPVSQLQEDQVRAYHENERHDMHKVLDKYIQTCERAGVRAEKLHIEMDSIEKGIVELISQHGIRKLVIGAAADKQYSRKMMEPKSKKAIYVRLQAPASCQIWFICKGNLIYTREGRLDGLNVGVASPSLLASPSTEAGLYTPLRSRSAPEGQNSQQLNVSDTNYRRASSDNQWIQMPRSSSSDETGGLTPHSRLSAEGSCYERDATSMTSPSLGSRFSTSSSEVVDVLSLISLAVTEGSGNAVEVPHHSFPPSVLEGSMNDEIYDQIEQAMAEAERSRRDAYEESIRRRKAERDAIEAIRRNPEYCSPLFTMLLLITVLFIVTVLLFIRALFTAGVTAIPFSSLAVMEHDVEIALIKSMQKTILSVRDNVADVEFLLSKQNSMLNEIKIDLESGVEKKAVIEDENDLHNEEIKKIEEAVEQIVSRAKTKEVSYAEELRRRKETEEALGRKTEELKMIKQQLHEVTDELHLAHEQKSNLETQISNSDQRVQELEQKIHSAVELLQNLKKEQDELLVERDDALRVAEELRRKQEEQASSSGGPQFFSEFSFFEIEEATSNFDPTLKIGEGGYGSIYKGLLRHTQVAIKMLHSHSSQGPSEFQQEVNILSKLRHPNLVTLVGACPDSWILIYEYLPNGSLEDRLICKDNTHPLSWQTRIRIATELCSVLIFLHSSSPHSIIHGDLKPANILLDANYVSKLSDFGICRVLSQNELSSNNTTLCCRTDPKGTFAYMDPEFLGTGELTTKSDVYSFGIILLRLLTGRPALGIIKEVEYALDKGNLKELLDPTAGDWPFVQAKQLAHLAISCCNRNRRIRPDFASEVWRVLEPMRVSCGASSFRLGSEEQVPHYFICPIFQEIMQDPVVAADGYTYEAEALRGWLDSGQDTSPMTNLKLNHCNLLPNHALRSAIQEWLQQK